MFEAASALGAETLNWHYVDVSSPNPTVDSDGLRRQGSKFVMMPMRSSEATPRKAPSDSKTRGALRSDGTDRKRGLRLGSFQPKSLTSRARGVLGTTFVAILGR